MMIAHTIYASNPLPPANVNNIHASLTNVGSISKYSATSETCNGQSYILYNNITNMEQLTEKYKKLIPEARICFAHGKMSKNEM